VKKNERATIFFCLENSYSIMKKHFKAYVNGFKGAKELRIKLMEANTAYDVEKIIKSTSNSDADVNK
jgi:tRNA-dihydrouridine synthase